MGLYFMKRDDIEQCCPVLAETPEEARAKIAKRTGWDIDNLTLYNANDEQDIIELIASVENRRPSQ